MNNNINSTLEEKKNAKNIKIASFLSSMFIWTMAFWVLTWWWWTMKIPILVNNYYYALIIAFIILIIAYKIIYNKFIEIEKNKPWFISNIFFNKNYDSKINYIWYETFTEVAKNIEKEYKDSDTENTFHSGEELLEVHIDTYKEWKDELPIDEYKKLILDEKKWLDEMLNTPFSSEKQKNAVKEGIELIKKYIDSELIK